jgi:hypothetical protein
MVRRSCHGSLIAVFHSKRNALQIVKPPLQERFRSGVGQRHHRHRSLEWYLARRLALTAPGHGDWYSIWDAQDVAAFSLFSSFRLARDGQ